jgi:osmotically-inducible protein OsmY
MGSWFQYAAARTFAGFVRREVASAPPSGEDYLLPDEKARQALCAKLAAEPNLAAGEIVVRVLSGELTLTGSVDTAAMKSRAEELAGATSGVTHVHNELSVRHAYSGTDSR